MYIHPSAEVESGATIGEGTKIWHICHVRKNAQIGQDCVLGRGVFVDAGVQIGNQVKIQNYVSVYVGVTIEDYVFVGPHVCFTNDMYPRAVNPDLTPKDLSNWIVTPTLVQHGASLGANSTIVCGITIGRWAMVGAGSTVTKDVPDHALVVGNPAKLIGYVCKSGRRHHTLDEAISCQNCME